MKRVTSKNGVPRIKVLSRADGFALLDREARAELGVSAQTFIRRWKSGQYAKRANDPKVVRVAMLIPLAR